MLNEFLLLIQVLCVFGMLLGCLRLGQSALAAFIALCGILANIFVLKQVSLFGLSVTTSDAFMIGSILGLNLMQEYFGRASARRAIGISFVLVSFYTIISQIHLLFAPTLHDTAHAHYHALMAPMPRILGASLIAYLAVQWCDYALYGFLKKSLKGRYLIMRNICSLSLTQLLDTVLFGFLGLYGLVASVGTIIVFSYVMKLVIILGSAPCIALTRFISKWQPVLDIKDQIQEPFFDVPLTKQTVPYREH